MIVVLPPDLPGSTLERLLGDLAAQGWAVDCSCGSENTVLLVAGPTEVEELSRHLVGVEADILPVLAPDQYRREQRRARFLSVAIGGLMLLVLISLLVPAWAFLQPPLETVVVPDLVHVRGADTLPVGGSLLVRIRGTPIHVLRLAPLRWHALSASCTHMERCLLEWRSDQNRLVCPCHGCVYDAYGNVLRPPASIPLPAYTIVESGGAIYIRRTLL